MTNTTTTNRTPLTITDEAQAWLDANRHRLGPAEIPGVKVIGDEKVATAGAGWHDPHFHTARTETSSDGVDVLPLSASQKAQRAAVADAQPQATITRVNRRLLSPAFNYGIKPEPRVYTGQPRQLKNTTAVFGENVRTFFKIQNVKNHRRSDGLRASQCWQLQDTDAGFTDTSVEDADTTITTLRDIYTRLNERQRHVAELLLDGKNHVQIAAVLGITKQTTGQIVKQIRAKLAR